MSDWFQRVPGFTRTAAGLERRILRRLPKVLVYGTLLLMLPSLLVRLAGEASADAAGASATMSVDILVAAQPLPVSGFVIQVTRRRNGVFERCFAC